MIIQDDRTAEQKTTHKWFVVMTDRFLSGWGEASGGKSYAAWACKGENLDTVERWVRSRGDAKYVRVTMPSWRPRGKGHAHIYVVEENHPSLA